MVEGYWTLEANNSGGTNLAAIEQVDILAFGPHPDDVELNIGGIVTWHARDKRVLVVDLSEGEMASNGTVEERRAESAQAAEIMGICGRLNLGLPDGGINSLDEEQQRRVVWALRRFRPEIVLLPYWEDRHPDHQGASALIDVALFKSGLRKFAVPENLPTFRPARWYYYPQHQQVMPQLVVDVTAVYQKKVRAIAAHETQFGQGLETYINQPIFLQKIRARDQYYGALINAEYGEGLLTREPIGLEDLFQLKGGM